MKGSTRLLVTMAAAVGLTACVLPLDVTIGDDEDVSIRGSGHVVTRSWTVGGFDAIHASGIGRVIVSRTGTEALTITGEDNILSQLVIEVYDGTLNIGPRAGVSLSPKRSLTIRIEVKELSRIEGSGAVGLEAKLGSAETLRVTLSGASRLEAEGGLHVLDVRTSGASWFWGRNLTSRSADVSASGAAAVVVSATERLHATASGVSSIRYTGSPTLRSNVSGLASVGPF